MIFHLQAYKYLLRVLSGNRMQNRRIENKVVQDVNHSHRFNGFCYGFHFVFPLTGLRVIAGA